MLTASKTHLARHRLETIYDKKRRQGRPAKWWRDDLDKYWSDTIWQMNSTRRSFGDDMLRPSPNHGTQRLPNESDDDPHAPRYFHLILTPRWQHTIFQCYLTYRWHHTVFPFYFNLQVAAHDLSTLFQPTSGSTRSFHFI